MKIYPAIDILEDKVVRLKRGDYAEKTTYSDKPVEIAQNFEKYGAKYIHIVDLSGAKNQNFGIKKTIATIKSATSLKIQVGGGIRTKQQVAKLIELGVDKVIIGSMAVSNEEEFIKILHLYAKNITLAIDVVSRGDDYFVATNAWSKLTNCSAFEVLDKYIDLGLEQVLCTDISRDGLLTGPNLDLYKKLKSRYPDICILASGGISQMDDLKNVQKEKFGGVIIGRAIYENQISLKELFNASQ